MWAALLANAAVDSDERELSPAFPEVLRQISGRDAYVLRELFQLAMTKEEPPRYLGTMAEIHQCFHGLAELQLYDCLENLIHHSVLASESPIITVNNPPGNTEAYERQYRITPFGGRFIHACEAPRKQ